VTLLQCMHYGCRRGSGILSIHNLPKTRTVRGRKFSAKEPKRTRTIYAIWAEYTSVTCRMGIDIRPRCFGKVRGKAD
jgi:hypothetical protein